jgi:ferredoxin, 2Fe-2S
MPKVTFITFAGVRHAVDATSGLSLMRAAVDHGVPGIDADCGGQCACATCHVFIAAPWFELTGERTVRESEMLNFAAELRETSRLACQIPVTDAMDGIEVQMPEAQH